MPNPPNSLDIVKLQLLDEGTAIMSEAQLAEQALVEQVAMRRRMAYRAKNPMEGVEALLEDDARTIGALASGVKPEPHWFGGQAPAEIVRNVADARDKISQDQAYFRGRANDMGKQQEFADMNDRAAARMGRAPSSTLLPDALLLDVPLGQGESALPEADPDLRFLPRAQPPAVRVSPYGGLMMEEDDSLPLSDRLFPQVY